MSMGAEHAQEMQGYAGPTWPGGSGHSNHKEDMTDSGRVLISSPRHDFIIGRFNILGFRLIKCLLRNKLSNPPSPKPIKTKDPAFNNHPKKL
jgi:hypothetical protein